MSAVNSSAPTILCVEDDADLLDEIIDTLGERGYRVIPANNAIQAQRFLAEQDADLVLCDIGMPGMSGYELLSWLRGLLPPKQNIPFVFLTAFSRSENEVRGLREGADDYLTKPVDYDRLASIIDARVRRVSSLRRELDPSAGGLSRIIDHSRRLAARVDRDLQDPVRRASSAITRLDLLARDLDPRMQSALQEARQSVLDIAGRVRTARTLLQVTPADGLIRRSATTQVEIMQIGLSRAAYALNEHGIDHDERFSQADDPLYADADKLALAIGNLLLYLAGTLGSNSSLELDARHEEAAVFDISSPAISLESLEAALVGATMESADLFSNPIDLGLVIARSLFQLHGGDIAALPRLGGGAVLRATIPWTGVHDR